MFYISCNIFHFRHILYYNFLAVGSKSYGSTIKTMGKVTDMKQQRNICLCIITLLLILIPLCSTTNKYNTCFAQEASNTATRIYQGIDVSVYQGNIDFRQVKAYGIEVVYIRAGEGYDYIDPYFEQNYTNALNAGLKIGYYHYVTASNPEEARSQAEFFYSLIDGKTIDCYPAMDFESFPGLSVEEINAIGAAYMETLSNLLGYSAAIYTDVNAIETIWDSTFTQYPLWVAEYGTGMPQSIGGWADWSGFQYSDMGNVSGIGGYVDLDYFKDSFFIDPSERPEPAPEPAPDPNPTNQTYTVVPGDTLSSIAARYRTTVAELAALNNILNPNLIYPGQVLNIPTFSAPVSSYTVRSGDTLSSIANRFDTSVQELVSLNAIPNPNLIYPGQVLRLPDNTENTFYRVKSGDTLSGIALRFDTSVSAIVSQNHITNPNLIYVGELLSIP